MNVGFKGKLFYQRFAVIQDLSSLFVLGMDFMKRASVTIHVPTRMALMGVNLPYPDELDEDGMDGYYPVGMP